MRSITWTLLMTALSLLLMTACRAPQVRYANRLVGEWNIATEKRVLVKADGKEEILVDTTNVGTLMLAETEEDGIFLSYTLSLADGSFSIQDQPFKLDNYGKRAFFYYFYCSELFGCDMIATIEEDQKDRQVWSFFRRAGTTSQGPEHRKTTWFLERK
ncbi:MAG: hypothetical protein AAGI38_10495 [Bacteroidota bacterium]